MVQLSGGGSGGRDGGGFRWVEMAMEAGVTSVVVVGGGTKVAGKGDCEVNCCTLV